jgi:hypothetical protein
MARLPASDLAPDSPTKEQRRQRATSPIFSPERASRREIKDLACDLTRECWADRRPRSPGWRMGWAGQAALAVLGGLDRDRSWLGTVDLDDQP